ncbi:MAG TPA: hypothetical protein VFY61_14575 [Pyrinomonadaceae bacterium]|nr:hypothetical protein [Pyrinomonadaceae bacterium]
MKRRNVYLARHNETLKARFETPKARFETPKALANFSLGLASNPREQKTKPI